MRDGKELKPCLSGRGVTKVFGFGDAKTVAVDHVDFDFHEGEFVSIVGESGSGKTTLSKMLLGLISVTEGEIDFQGKPRDISNGKKKKEYWKGIQAIFQDPFASYNMFKRVDSVLLDCINMRGDKNLPKEEKERLMTEACSFVNLKYAELTNKYPFELSGGQMQRLMIARIFLLKPKILLADEPTSMIDACSRATILDMLLKLEHSDKDGSFYVAANYKDDVIYLEDTLRSTDTYQSDDSAKDLRSHLATADAAAIFAHAYLVYREIPAYADFADTCLETALRAWNWVTDPSNPKHMSIGAANRTYTFTQEEFDRDLFWAAGSLYRAVKTAGGDVSPYENYLLANCNTDAVQNCFKNISLSYNHAGESFLGFFHYLYQNEQPNAAMTEAFSNFNPWRTNMLQHNNWGMVFPNWGYWWGSNRNVAQNAMTLLLGSVILEGQDNIPTAVSEAADHAFDYLLGDNPISFSYVSGYGERSVENIYSKIYSVDAALTPYQVPKGYVTEGTNYHNNRHLSKFDGKCYMDSDTEYTTNENTIYGNASALFLTAAVIAGHTEPDPEPDTVQGDVNADGTFDLADVVMLQKWLIRAGTLTDWTAGDWNDDETITVVDLCLMKRALQQA